MANSPSRRTGRAPKKLAERGLYRWLHTAMAASAPNTTAINRDASVIPGTVFRAKLSK